MSGTEGRYLGRKMVPLEMLTDEHKAVTVEVAYVGPDPSMNISPESEASSIA